LSKDEVQWKIADSLTVEAKAGFVVGEQRVVERLVS
jgi:hypothetical protein